MTRKATEPVTTIGIDIDKNTLHLIGLDAEPEQIPGQLTISA